MELTVFQKFLKAVGDIDLVYSEKPNQVGKTYCRHMGMLNNIDEFDPLFFNISPVGGSANRSSAKNVFTNSLALLSKMQVIALIL